MGHFKNLVAWGLVAGLACNAAACRDVAHDATLSADEAEDAAAALELAGSAPAAATVYVVPLNSELKSSCPATDGTCVDPELIASVRSFQGLANATAPRLFVINSPADEAWLAQLTARYPHYGWHRLGSTQELFTHPAFADVTRRMVVFRREQSPIFVNAAITAAAVEQAVLVEGKYLPFFQQNGFQIATDLTGKTFANPNALQNWVFDTYRKRCNNRMYGMSQGYLNTPNPERGIDYYVRKRMCVYHIATDPKHENNHGFDSVQAQKRILASYKPMSMALGFWGNETADVPELSRHAHVVFLLGHNHSLLTHIGVPPMPKPAGERTNDVKFKAGKSYVTFVATQGSDAMGYHQNFTLDYLTAQSRFEPGRLVRDRFPFSIMSAAPQMHFQPAYFRTQAELMSRQTFIDKGFGYTLLNQFPQKHRARWLQVASRFLELAKIRD